jgi:hypothetical protein
MENSRKEKIQKLISLSKCKAILNKNGKNYSDENVIAIRDFLIELAEIDYEIFIDNDQKKKLEKHRSKQERLHAK